MNVDPNGNAWWHWLAGALAVIGVALVVAAITVLTAGVGTTVMVGTLAGAVIHGAAVGTLIGAGVGVVAGGIIGGAIANELANQWFSINPTHEENLEEALKGVVGDYILLGIYKVFKWVRQ